MRARREKCVSRREFAGMLTGGMLAFGAVPVFGAPAYKVGVANSEDAYSGTVRALNASGEFPDVSGRPVLIKPNLVSGQDATTGVTTDPEVVRAIVDRALLGGASRIKIIEGGTSGANFDVCGYGFFRKYSDRVVLIDLSTEAFTLFPVPPGTAPAGLPAPAPNAYRGLYLPNVVRDPSAVFITVGKLKTHAECKVTLSLKNIFGLPPIVPYLDPDRENFRPRYSLHSRSMGQVVADIARARPIQFAVVDGIWGLEGEGPVLVTGASQIRSNVIVAGANAAAVDLVCLNIMDIPSESVQHLEYAYLTGLGPHDLSQIEVAGDTVNIPPFRQPAVIPPKVWFPKMVPVRFSPARGEKTTITARAVEPAQIQVQVIRTFDQVPTQIIPVRTLLPWTEVTAGSHAFEWDGRDDAGQLVPASVYGVRVQGRRLPEDNLLASAINWVVTVA